MKINLSVTKKQKAFIDAKESEVLFGGAAGGGKSYGQMVDALLFALKYPGSKQLVLRRSFAELDKSLIRTSLALFPRINPGMTRATISSTLPSNTLKSIIKFSKSNITF